MSMERFKRFVEDHKKELIATTAVAGGIVLVVFRCKRHSGKMAKGIFRRKDISIPDGLKVWDTSYLWVVGSCLYALVARVPVDDLGELGEQSIELGLAQPGDLARRRYWGRVQQVILPKVEAANTAAFAFSPRLFVLQRGC